MSVGAQVMAAIDFGISNTDAVARVGGEWRRWTQATHGDPTPESVRAILARGGVSLDALAMLAVTGGRHKDLPETIGGARVVAVNEVTSIGRGGQAALSDIAPDAARRKRILVVSAGSGTAAIAAQGNHYQHITGAGIGGGTLLGMGRLLLGTVDPVEIDALALQGDTNRLDLSLADVITGPIGSLPPTATAVNFGRVAREPVAAGRADTAASLVTLVGQVIGLLSIAAARALDCEQIVVIGHMTDAQSVRNVVGLVSEYYSTPILLPENAGYYTAIGALLTAEHPRRKDGKMQKTAGKIH